jgi:hypothetical protein
VITWEIFINGPVTTTKVHLAQERALHSAANMNEAQLTVEDAEHDVVDQLLDDFTVLRLAFYENARHSMNFSIGNDLFTTLFTAQMERGKLQLEVFSSRRRLEPSIGRKRTAYFAAFRIRYAYFGTRISMGRVAKVRYSSSSS